MGRRQERSDGNNNFRNFIITISLFLVIIVLGGGTFAFYELNKTEKIDTQEELSPVKKHAQSAVSSSDKTSSFSSSSIDTNAPAESTSELSSSDEYYVNAYGHTIKKGEQDSTGMAVRNRERNVDQKNLDYIMTSSLTYEQKIIQMKAWGFSFTPNTPSDTQTIWGRDTSTETGPLGTIYPDGTVTKK